MLLPMAAGADVLRLDPVASQVRLEPAFEVFRDVTGRMGPGEAARARFEPNPGRAGLGFPGGALWVRATIENPSPEARTWFLVFEDPNLSRIDLWLGLPGGVVERRGGYSVPRSERTITMRGPWHEVPLVVLANERVDLLARLESPGPVYALARLSEGSQVGQDLVSRLVREGLHLGLLLAIGVLNLYSYLVLRERGYLAFLGFSVALVGLEISETGLGAAYLFPGWPTLAGAATPFFAGLAIALAVHFADAYLGVRPGRAGRLAIVAGLAAAVTAIVSPRAGSLAAVLSGALALPVMVARTAGALRGGTRAGRFFAVAMAPLLPAAVAYGLTAAGLVPETAAARHLVHLAFAFTAFVVAFALADRVRTADEQARAGLERAVSARTQELATTVEALRREGADRLRAEEGRRESEEKLRHAQRIEAVGRLAGGIAHDYNNLLTSVTTNLAILRMEPEPQAEERRSILDDVSAAAERGANLTRQLLAFSRRQVLSPQPLDVNRVVEGFRRLLDRLLGETCRLRLQLAPGLPPIVADPSQLEQVLMNLVINARDAMPGGGTITVTTEELRVPPGAAPPALPGDFVRISVTDTGGGIAPEVMPHVFEPFFTTKPEGKGTGLGLATVHGIVSQHLGFVEVEPGYGHGATFRACFPVADAGAVATAGRAPGQRPLPGGHETVVLVEDEPVVREGTRRLLSKLGYRVLAAHDAADALRICESAERLDLVITDLVMPDMDGVTLAERVRARWPGVALLLTSGHGHDVLSGYATAGVHPFLPKPFSAADLAAKVREVLAAARGSG